MPETVSSAPQPAPEAPAYTPYQAPAAAYTPYQAQGFTPYQAPEKKRRKKWPFIVGGAALAVVACAILLVLYFAGDLGSKSADAGYDPSAESDLLNGGDMTYDSGRLYFIGVFNDDDSSVSVYSTDLNGGGKTSLSTNGDIYKIRASGDKIYYEACDDDGIYSIGCFSKDGTQDKTILRFSYGNKLRYFSVVGSWLYYSLDNNLHRCDLSGGNDETLLRDIYAACAVGSNIYYTDIDSVNVFHTEDKTSDELCTADAYALLYDNGFVYFTTLDGLYSVPAGGGDATCLVQSEYVGTFLSVKGEYILFIQTNETVNSLIYGDSYEDPYGLLYAVDKSGGTPVKCSDQQLCTVFTTPSETYYLPSFTDYTGKVPPLEDMTIPGAD